MPDLSAANAARLNAALDKRYRFSFGVFTFREAIESGKFSHAEQGETPSVPWDRRKFNRMGPKEQAEYQRKLNTLKPEYRLFNAGCPHGSWVAAPKIVFDWYQARNA
jgi:hypothetical protein